MVEIEKGKTGGSHSADSLKAAVKELRKRRAETLAVLPQTFVVDALAEMARRWRDPSYALRWEAETWSDPFPFAMVQVSLDALLASLAKDALWELISAENANEALGYPVVGQVIAGNTPLLAWVSMIRALLVRSASLVKLPSNSAARWAFLFHQSLTEIAPELAACVHLIQWPGGTAALEAALCAEVDLVMAQGSDATLESLNSLCPAGTPFIGYGHRISFGLLMPGADWKGAAWGFAKDVLLYDQGGCLSPQTIFVQGNWNDALGFAALLADALAEQSVNFPLPIRAGHAAQAVRQYRALAWMEDGTVLWEDPGLRWTVAARTQTEFAGSPTFGVISVQPLASLKDLPLALSRVADHLQGCAAAGTAQDGYVPGVTYLCEPGGLQAPPLGWRQDGRDVLRVLLPPAAYRADGSTTMRISAGSV